MFKIVKIFAVLVVVFLLLFALVSLCFYLARTPSNERQWDVGQQTLQKVSVEGAELTIKKLRDYAWANHDNPVHYRDVQLDISDIESVEVGVSHFSEHEGIAHVFLIFGVRGQEDIALSVEARRTVGEEYTITGGVTFAFDLAYFLTSKKDVISIRALRDERVQSKGPLVYGNFRM